MHWFTLFQCDGRKYDDKLFRTYNIVMFVLFSVVTITSNVFLMGIFSYPNENVVVRWCNNMFDRKAATITESIIHHKPEVYSNEFVSGSTSHHLAPSHHNYVLYSAYIAARWSYYLDVLDYHITMCIIPLVCTCIFPNNLSLF